VLADTNPGRSVTLALRSDDPETLSRMVALSGIGQFIIREAERGGGIPEQVLRLTVTYDRRSTEELMAQIEEITDPDVYNAAKLGILSRLGSEDPALAIDLLSKMDDPTLIEEGREQVAWTWGKGDWEAALEWAEGVDASEVRTFVLVNAAQSDFNPDIMNRIAIFADSGSVNDEDLGSILDCLVH